MSLVLSISAFYQIVYSLIFHDLGPGNGNFLLKNWPYLLHKSSNIGILESKKTKQSQLGKKTSRISNSPNLFLTHEKKKSNLKSQIKSANMPAGPQPRLYSYTYVCSFCYINLSLTKILKILTLVQNERSQHLITESVMMCRLFIFMWSINGSLTDFLALCVMYTEQQLDLKILVFCASQAHENGHVPQCCRTLLTSTVVV